MTVARRSSMFAVALAIGAFSASGSASAITVSFAPYNADASGLNLSVDVTADGSTAMFVFSNDSTGSSAGSSLARIYFESGLGSLGLSGGTVLGGAGTEFSSGYPGPNSPPAGNTVAWAGELAAFGAVSPPPHNGLNVGETLTLAFAYDGTLGALLNALIDPSGNSRIAGHVLNCIDGDSCAAQTVKVIPIPAALPLMLSGLAGLAMIRRRRSARV